MDLRRLLLIAAAVLAAVPAPAQTRVSGAAAESAASAPSGASVQGRLGGSLAPVPLLSLTVPALGGTPALAPPVAVAAQPAAGALVQAAAPAQALAPALTPARAAAASRPVSASPGQATLPDDFGSLTDPRAREARERIEEARAQWKERTEAEERASEHLTAGDFLAEQKRARAATLRLAASQARLGPIEGPLARLGWKLEAARLERAADAAQRQTFGVERLLELAGGRLSESRRRDLEDLRAYVPGLDPAKVTGGEGLAYFSRGGVPAGYATLPLAAAKGGEFERGFVWMSDRLTPAQFVEVAAHEGFHQGDAGYAAGEKSLSARLDGADAAPLMLALVEGYTELRAREAHDRLGRDAAVQEFGLPQRYASYLRAQWGGTLPQAIAARDAARALHSYEPFVELVRAVAGRPKGRAALDALVGQGDAGPLADLLGQERLVRLAAHASAADHGKDALPYEARLADSLGVTRWLQRRTAAAARDEQVRSPWELKRRAYAGVNAALSAVMNAGAWSRDEVFRALSRVDLTAELESGAPVAELRAKVEAAAANARRWAWLTAGPRDLLMRVGRGDALAIAAAYIPGGAVLALAMPYLGGGGPLAALAVLAALTAMWAGLQVLGAYRLVTRPSRWLPSRWAPPR